MPTFAEWEKLSGGRQGRELPLLKHIDKLMYEHSIYARFVQQHSQKEAERLSCVVQILYAAHMYIKAYSNQNSTFSSNRRNPIRADGYKKVGPNAQDGHSRIDAVEALEEIVLQELIAVTGAPSKEALKQYLKQSQVVELTGHGKKADSGGAFGVDLRPTYLTKNESSKYRILLENGEAFMHPRDPQLNPLGWVLADTKDCPKDNPCSKEIYSMLASVEKNENIKVKDEVVNKTNRGLVVECRNAGIEGYVMTHSRKLYMSASHVSGSASTAGFYHSAYTGGKSVVCSGSICFVKGKPILLTNFSGHYQPHPRQLVRVIELFEMAGVTTTDLSIFAQITDKDIRFFGRKNGGRQIDDFRRAVNSWG